MLGHAVNVEGALTRLPVRLSWGIEEVAPLVQHRLDVDRLLHGPPMLPHRRQVTLQLLAQVCLVVYPPVKVWRPLGEIVGDSNGAEPTNGVGS